ncbi:MAG: hypothetical protein LBK02_05730 [Treponema sp.]|jgi:hypothetical protein|nr:hypothetical protein [Treponema sp.]
MFVFLIIVAIIIVIIVLVKKNNRKKAVEELISSPAYEVASEIKNVLTQKGHKVSGFSTYFVSGIPVGCFDVHSDPGEDSIFSLHIRFSRSPLGRYSEERSIRSKNLEKKPYQKMLGGHFYAIQDANTGLIVASNVFSKEIPPLIEIAADVIKNSRYEFEHPEWMYEHPEAREYLNVMFQ